MYKGMPQDCCNTISAAREPVAAEICKFAAGLAERAENLAARLSGKLSPVTTSATPTCGMERGIDSKEYPPLFAELRTRFFTLETAMNQIEDTLSRTEL
jgi:hypothetical protein